MIRISDELGWVGKIAISSVIVLMLILSVQIIYQPIKVAYAQCSGAYPYLHSDGQCWNVPECGGSYPYPHSDGQCWNVPECGGSYPYPHSDGQCWNVPEGQ